MPDRSVTVPAMPRRVARAAVAPLRAPSRRVRAVLAGWAGVPACHCPICGYRGPFVAGGGRYRRPMALCPHCGSAERHRLVAAAAPSFIPTRPDVTLHVAAEPHLARFFESRTVHYFTTGLAGRCDVRTDLTRLALRTASVDLVVAVHVLEHIADDDAAVSELARVLRPGGWAIVAVPIVADETVEYASVSAGEHGHVRAPGRDWYERLDGSFSAVQLVSSDDVDPGFQTRLFEDRTRFPTPAAPERPPQSGLCHLDHVAFARR